MSSSMNSSSSPPLSSSGLAVSISSSVSVSVSVSSASDAISDAFDARIWRALRVDCRLGTGFPFPARGDGVRSRASESEIPSSESSLSSSPSC